MGSGFGLGAGRPGPRWRTIASALVLLAPTACGILFAPGDYTDSPARAEPDADTTTDAAPVVDAVAPTDGASDAAAPSVARIVLVAGQRDAVPGETSPVHVLETFHTTVSEAGELGPWTWDVSPPVAASWTRAEVFGGSLWLQQGTTVYRADFDERITGAWEELPLQGGALVSLQRGWLADAGLLSAGGVAGSPVANVYRAAFTDAGMGPWEAVVDSGLEVARGDVTLLRHGSFLYAIGGRVSSSSATNGRDEVEVATIGADGLPGPFVATEKLGDGDGGSHGVMLPSVATGAGHLVVIGGWTTGTSTSLTDVALAAKIDEATGMLGKWTALPRIPTPMSSAAVLVVASTIFVFGGATLTGPSDAVMALPIHADGTFGAEWKRVASLPGPRASLVGVVY